MSTVVIPAPPPFASATVSGIVSTGTQTFAGTKSFTSAISAAAGVTYSDGVTQTLSSFTRVLWNTNALTAETGGRTFETSNSSVQLADGRIFIVGGQIATENTSELINAAGTSSAASGTPTNPRAQGVRYCLLNNGDVLVVGGFGSPTTSETWNPGTGLFTARGACSFVNGGGIQHLDNGNAVVFGGINFPTILDTAQIYSATGFTWSATGNMTIPRNGFGYSFRIPGGTIGKVFVAGGTTTSGDQTNTSEIYNGDTGTWAAAASMSINRADGANCKLNDGRIMFAGGVNTFGNTKLASVEIYTPGSDTWATTGSLLQPRQGGHAICLSDNRVIVTGGFTDQGGNAPTEIWNGSTWSELCPGLTGSEAFSAGTIYGADLKLLTGLTGISAVVAIGGAAGSNIVRDIRRLQSGSPTLKDIYQAQGNTPFVFPNSINQSILDANRWIIQSNPGFGPLLQVSGGFTSDPTYGAGVKVGGDTFFSLAGQNIFNSTLQLQAGITNGTSLLIYNSNPTPAPADVAWKFDTAGIWDSTNKLISVNQTANEVFSIDGEGTTFVGKHLNVGSGGNGTLTMTQGWPQGLVAATYVSISDYVDDSATIGDSTVNATKGVSTIANGTQALTITNDRCQGNVMVIPVLQTSGGGDVISNCVVSFGQFVIELVAPASADLRVAWYLI